MKKLVRTGSVAFVAVLALLAFAGLSTGVVLAQEGASSASYATMTSARAEAQTIAGSVVWASKSGTLLVLVEHSTPDPSHSGRFMFFEVASEAYSSLYSLKPGDSVTVGYEEIDGHAIAQSIDEV